MLPKEKAVVSGWDCQQSLRHVHCPNCGRIIAQVLLTKLGIETYDRLVNWILHYVGKVRFPKFSE